MNTPRPSDAVKQRPRRTILVAEDHPAVRQLLVRMLEKRGFHAIEAGSGPDSLAALEAYGGAVHLAIVDIVMPGMSGLDLSVELGRKYPGLKVLFISGYADSVIMESLMRRSPEAVLSKPFTEKQLIARMARLLES